MHSHLRSNPVWARFIVGFGRTRPLALWLALWGQTYACVVPPPEGRCLRVDLVEGRTASPSEVLLYLSVQTCQGAPFPGLEASDLVIQEDGRELPAFDIGPRILPLEPDLDRFTALLLDVSSASVSAVGLQRLVEAVRGFLDQVSPDHAVAIYLFDTLDTLQELTPFTRDATALEGALTTLQALSPLDSDANLNGALRLGLGALNARAEARLAPLRVGTLVVFTAGPHYVMQDSNESAVAKVATSPHFVHTIGLGRAIAREHVVALGKSGAELLEEPADVPAAFARTAAASLREGGGFYRLGYCSPQRSGAHVVRLHVRGAVADPIFALEASGFFDGCEPTQLADPCRHRECGTQGATSCGECTGMTPHCDPRGRCVAAPESPVWIPLLGGDFSMGSLTGETNERPPHRVIVPPFLMTQTEVTVRQYAACASAGYCYAPWTDSGCTAGMPGGHDLPLNCVTWERARRFCEWWGARLPTEAEWEYAARSGGHSVTYPWGTEEPSCYYTVMDDGRGACAELRTMEACSRPAGSSGHGVCDLAGNLDEWVEDWYHASYEGAPTDGSAWVFPMSAGRVTRGGSYRSSASGLRVTGRGLLDPAIALRDVGFRCVR